VAKFGKLYVLSLFPSLLFFKELEQIVLFIFDRQNPSTHLSRVLLFVRGWGLGGEEGIQKGALTRFHPVVRILDENW
jgi:hypothetical protein